MKKGHSGKIRFFLNIVSGQVITFPSSNIYWDDKVDPSYVSIGMFYSFAEFNATFNDITSTWVVTRGKTIAAKIVLEYNVYSVIEPDYFKKIIAARVIKKLMGK